LPPNRLRQYFVCAQRAFRKLLAEKKGRLAWIKNRQRGGTMMLKRAKGGWVSFIDSKTRT